MGKKITIEKFIERAKEKHGDKYNYSKVIYKNKDELVTIICPEHGEFLQTPANHYKHGCSKCGHILTNSFRIDKGKLEFIDKANKIHNFKYNYSKSNYVDHLTKICIICPEHGEFWQTPAGHLTGRGCKLCKNLKLSLDRRSNVDDFKNKASLIHKNLYDYSNVEYINAQTKILIKCKIHGDFLQTPNHHLQGQGCPICKQSKGEKIVEEILIKYNIPFKREVTFTTNEIVRNTKKFRIDFVINKNDVLYFIEYNGLQHYEPIEFFGGETSFILQQKRDKYVRGLVSRNVHKLKLLEISYKNSIEIIENKIIKFLNITCP